MKSIIYTVTGTGPGRFARLEAEIHNLITKRGYIALTGGTGVPNEYSVDVSGLPRWIQNDMAELRLDY